MHGKAARRPALALTPPPPPNHAGGANRIYSAAGTDATSVFYGSHGGPGLQAAEAMLAGLPVVGTLAAS